MQGASQIDTSDTLDQLGQLKHQLKEAKEEAGRLANVTSGFDPTGLVAGCPIPQPMPLM